MSEATVLPPSIFWSIEQKRGLKSTLVFPDLEKLGPNDVVDGSKKVDPYPVPKVTEIDLKTKLDFQDNFRHPRLANSKKPSLRCWSNLFLLYFGISSLPTKLTEI